MRILADKDGIAAIQMLLAVALKAGGVQNFAPVRQIMNAVQPLPAETPKTKQDVIGEEDTQK